MLKKMKIRARMLTSYVVIIALTVIAGVVSITMLRTVGANLTGFYDKQFQTVDQTWAGRRAVYAAQSGLFQAIVESDQTQINKLVDDAATEAAALVDAIANVRKTFEGDTTLLDAIEQELSTASSIRQTLSNHIKAQRNDVAYEILTQEYMPITDSIRANLIKIGEQADANAAARVQDGEKATVQAVVVVTVIVVASAIIGIGFALVISNSIIKPVNEIEGVARGLSQGVLRAELTYHSNDELGHLAESMRETMSGLSAIIEDLGYLMNEIASGNFNSRSRNTEGYVGDFEPFLINIRAMNNSLSETLRQIDETAEQVSSGSDQVSSGAQALSQGAAEQASSVEELAATVNEISAQIKNSAAMAQSVSENASNVGTEIEASNRQMNEMTAAMEDISRSSSEIGKIIKTIEDIAFQTNILALNAAVEAARAGAAGKGFAVVADEVRNLASKSAEASKNTASLIESSIHSVENGKHIAEATAASLLSVVAGARDIVTSVNQISEDTVSQATAVSQISQGIDQISSVVQTNSATAEESAAASEELSAQALNLKTLVSRFTLRE